jgi:hypothetical protein
VGVEEADPAARHDERGRGQAAVVLEVQQVVADLVFAEPVRRRVVVVGELPDGAEVGALGTFAEAGQLQVLGAPADGAAWSWEGPLAEGKVKKPLRMTFRQGLRGGQGSQAGRGSRAGASP